MSLPLTRIQRPCQSVLQHWRNHEQQQVRRGNGYEILFRFKLREAHSKIISITELKYKRRVSSSLRLVRGMTGTLGPKRGGTMGGRKQMGSPRPLRCEGRRRGGRKSRVRLSLESREMLRRESEVRGSEQLEKVFRSCPVSVPDISASLVCDRRRQTDGETSKCLLPESIDILSCSC